LGDRLTASESLEGVACIFGAEGQAERAAGLFGAAEALRESVGSELLPEEDAFREPYLATTRSRLDEATWQAARAEGLAMSMERAIEYTLSEEEPTSPISPASTGLSPDELPTALTRREGEVARLVTQGFTNRQIASKLVLSEHTVHHHVTNILRKLNLRSRDQISSRVDHQ
jgi:DNA-binding CsgD family transcriptional regulator